MIRLAMTVMLTYGGGVGCARSKQRLQLAECGGDGAAIVNHSRSVADQFSGPTAPALGCPPADNRDSTEGNPRSFQQLRMESDLPHWQRMTIEVCLGRGLALLVHPAAAWRRLPARGRVILLSAYVTVSYVAVLSALLVF